MLLENDDRGLAEITKELHPAMLAEITEGLSVEETWYLLDRAELHRQAEMFSFLPVARQVELVSGVGRKEMGELIDAMPHDTRVELIRQLNPEIVEELLPLVTKADREDI